MSYEIYVADCIEWMQTCESNTIQAIVTDPPYGLREYTETEMVKLRSGRGGVWRIPPSFDGCKRSPLPRFTVLSDGERVALGTFFARFAAEALRVLTPGAHLFIASNPLLSHLVYGPLIEAGFRKARRDYTARSNAPWRRSAEERARRVFRRNGIASLAVGALGTVS